MPGFYPGEAPDYVDTDVKVIRVVYSDNIIFCDLVKMCVGVEVLVSFNTGGAKLRALEPQTKHGDT